jgi:protein arginine N-methyltransferase 1
VNYLALDSFEAAMEDQLTHQTYYKAIMQNQHLFAGKTVLHITDGVNCLYSIFAAQAGSRKVYTVLNGDSNAEMQSAYMMREVVKENNLEGVIEVLCWREFNAEVDIILGEPMGYCLHFDGLLDRIIEARDLFLTKRGIIFPNLLSFKCALVHDEYFSDHKVNYWEDVYGVPMGSMKKWISHEPIIRIVDPSLIVSNAAKLVTFDLNTASY